ncbi:hypothetical protein [Paenibacillus andongensis]|uniref:hypothetical protein n=1 Tax=Paenibacillus andongensis TaxID=2975482 RepID=UPI0021BAE994|nr:hypothetical protein [Paenibacillus andongensis]
MFGLLLVLHLLASLTMIGPVFVMTIIRSSVRTVRPAALCFWYNDLACHNA